MPTIMVGVEMVISNPSVYEYKEIAKEFMFRFGHYIKDNNESIATKIYHLEICLNMVMPKITNYFNINDSVFK